MKVVTLSQSTVIFYDQENNKTGIGIMFPSLAAALDRVKISDRNATNLFAALIDALKLHPNNYNINRSAIYPDRIFAQSKIASLIREDLQAAPSLVVY